MFWHYLQDSTLRPEVTTEQLPTCAPIYDSGRRTLLFRVTHYRQRINLEVFHALSDGTGALWFLTDVIAAYLQRHDPQPAEASTENQQTSLIQELTRDSFAEYFRPKHPSKKRARPPWKTDTTETDLRQPKTRKTTYFKGAYRIKGTRTPDHRTRLIELTVPAKPILALAHGESVSPTIYLTAMFFEALRTAAQPVGQSMTYGASIPVNLRQFSHRRRLETSLPPCASNTPTVAVTTMAWVALPVIWNNNFVPKLPRGIRDEAASIQ